jgi:hypothetical protein
MAAVPFRLDLPNQNQYLRWENQINNYLYSAEDALKGVEELEAKVRPEVERLRGEIHKPTTKSGALNVQIICILTLKVFALAGAWISSNSVFSAIKLPIFAFISRISYASPISWIVAFIVSTIAFNIMTGIADWVLEPFRKKIMETDGFKLMQEVYKVRGCLAVLRDEISKVEKEIEVLKATALKEGGMVEGEKNLLTAVLVQAKIRLNDKKTELEQWYTDQKVNEVVGWHRFVIPLLEEKDFSNAIFRFIAP